MKRLLSLLAVATLAVGCHAQVTPNPTTYACPATSGTAYTPLNQSAPATGLAYTDTHPAAGHYCYIAQSVSGAAVSDPSNVAGPFSLSGSNSVALSWAAPASGPVPTGYVLSRAPAVTSTLLAPTLGTGSVATLRRPTDGPLNLRGRLR